MAALLAARGVGERVARKVFARVHAELGEQPRRCCIAAVADVRRELADPALFPDLEIVERRRADDGFVKYLFRLADGAQIEAVRIPLPDSADARALKEKRRRGEAEGLVALPTAKYTVCISSQVGCALGCAFCATGQARVLAQPRDLGNPGAGPRHRPRSRPSRSRRALPGHGRAAAQLRQRHGRGAHSLPSRGPGHLGRRHLHLDGGRGAGHPPLHRREASLPPHRLAGRAHARDALAAHAHRGALAARRARARRGRIRGGQQGAA